MFLDFLTKTENKNIDKYWDFINTFKNVFKKLKVSDNYFTYNGINGITLFSVFNYRRYMIKHISKKYTINDFYKYEQMLNKILYVLLKKYVKIKKICKIYKVKNIEFIEKENRSYINKKYIYNESDKYYYYSNFYENHTKLYNNSNYKKYLQILYVIMNKDIFYKVITTKNLSKNLYLQPILYYPYDYPFPNLTLYFRNNNSKKTWLNRIKKYYYNKNDEYWYKII